MADISGAIIDGGVPQALVSANSLRSAILIQNPQTAAGQGIASAESLFVNTEGAAGVNDGHSIEILPGGSQRFAEDSDKGRAISVIAATIGHRFIAREY